jgi:hypothetical protein
MRSALASIKESANISNRFLAIVGVIAVIISTIITFFVSKRITNPIRKLRVISEKMTHLDFNVKWNSACLHFRYEGIKLVQKDVVYFVSALPFLELTVVQKPHQYKGKMKEVDFYLSEDDINKLKDKPLCKIYIKHANGDSPFEEDVSQSCDDEYSITKFGEIGLFQQYINLYGKALDTCINGDIRDLTKHIARRMGIREDEAMQLLCQQNVSSSKEVKIKYDYCYVYLMHDKRNGYHKIGISKTPEYREKTLQSEQPNIEMVCFKRYPSRKIAKAFESALHDAYAEQRVRGEWFNLSEIDIEMLKESLS